jgi:LysM repeat protein/uncharacterized coiled-coil DUF342 family protein
MNNASRTLQEVRRSFLLLVSSLRTGIVDPSLFSEPRKKSLTFLLLSVFLLSNSNFVVAYKIDTHIFIAQEVLNDLVDGMLTVMVGDRPITIPIRSQDLQAIRDFPEYFRMGSIGPDAFPDVLIGQMIIHPSIEGGWGTAEWLRHLANTPGMTAQERAFVLGYFTHAAADILAHTYVNRYAGDVFDITDNETAAKRHVMIESFISNHMPPITNHLGQPIGLAHELVRTADGRLAIPTSFIHNRLMFDNEALSQIRASGSAPYLGAIQGLKQSLDNFVEPGGIVDDLEELGLQLAAALLFDIPLSEKDAENIRKFAEDIRNLGPTADLIEAAKFFDEQTLELISGAREEIEEILRPVFQEVDRWIEDYNDLVEEIADLHDEITSLTNRIAAMPDEILVEIERETCETACRLLSVGGWIPFIKEICDTACRTYIEYRREINQVKLRLQGELGELQGRLFRLQSTVPVSTERVFNAALAALDVAIAIHELHIIGKQIAYDFFSDEQSLSLIGTLLQGWREDIDTAMYAYIEANGQALVNSIASGDENFLDPYLDWLQCYFPGLLGIPIDISSGICRLEQGVANIFEKIDEFEQKLAEIHPITRELIRLKQQLDELILGLKEELTDYVVDAALREIGELAGFDALLWKNILSTPVDNATLNTEFTTDESQENLLLIPDIAERIESEMYLNDEGQFDSKRYAVVNNSIILAKLALLDQAGLQTFARLSGLTETTYGTHLYEGDATFASNILYGFAKNIDGNHQWHVLSPPHPRLDEDGIDLDEVISRLTDIDKRFGYVNVGCERVKGMRMWIDPLARPVLFESVFQGPLVPGVDLPQSLGSSFPSILPSNYPNTITASNPWGQDGSLISYGAAYADPLDSYVISGRSVPGHTVIVRLRENGQEIGRAVVNEGGEWSIQFTQAGLSCDDMIEIEYRDQTQATAATVSTVIGGADFASVASYQQVVSVEQGDSLWTIAEEVTGDGRNYLAILDANKDTIKDPDMIYPGQSLVVPTLIEVTRGDSLWSIAIKITGDGRNYVSLFGANRSSIQNPNLIYPSQHFVVPTATSFAY